MTRIAFLLAPIVLAACASSAEPAASPTVSALDTLKAGGTFAFVLDESAPGVKLHASCAAEHPGDPAAASACYEAIRQVAAHEGIRFSQDPAGRLIWTSYGVEEGKPATYIEGALSASLEPEGIVAAKFAEAPHGLSVDKHPMDPTMVLRFQVVDASTVITDDPHKGRLVFRRSTGAGG
jgi:hypothetical protein